ncbi:MAG: DegV family protein [Lachnospiraceae bacterium]|nr:DegV family protein [Lachnospiraceae bacterium]
MKTAVVTDSNSGIFGEEARQLGIHVIPMPVIIDDHTYFENEDITHTQFFEAQLAQRAVSSSQPSPASLMDVWELVLDSADELIYIPMSSGLSGSYQTAAMLAEDYDGKVEVADGHRVSVTQRQSVMLACRLAEEGMSAAQIKERLEADAFKSCIYLTVESLEYFKRSGRVTAATAMLAGILNIKPVLVCRGENFDTHAKVRGLEKARSSVIEALKAERESRFAEYSDSQLIIGCAGSFLEKEDVAEWQNRVREAFPNIASFYDPLSLSVCCHTGPNAAGVGIALNPSCT